MKRKIFVGGGIILGVLVLLCLLIAFGAPLFVQLGGTPVCIQGDWPDIKVVSCPKTVASSSVVTPFPLPALSGQPPTPIIVDDDGSPDGMIALLYFLRNPLFDVRAVTISCGEAHPEVFAGRLVQFLTSLGRADIPVGFGRSTPLEGTNAFPDPWRAVSDDFWNLPLPQAPATAQPVPAAELMIKTLSRAGQPVAVFVSGPHTNLAEALRREPGIKEHIRDVYIMGGSIHTPGNIESDWPEIQNKVAEWNIWVDPVAASEVFASGLALHLIPLDATRQVTWTKSDLPGWNSSGAPEGRRAGELLQWMLDTWSPSGVYIWDLVAAVAATDSRYCPEVPLALEVIVAPGPEQGRTVIKDRPANAGVCLEPIPEQVKARANAILGQ